ncbi:RecQ family zinc-binding domain-containing protein [Streptomyces canarius]|uniref:RecQ family zinc-binding domain-containing protein n=1 Tax=Streptomyces canarius TaxID=285453 RepID=UPI002795CC63|nr:RecQ family zinc-binding domain-containing protein [Streptomyces canarius]
MDTARAYAETTGCRRHFLLGHFGEAYEAPCGELRHLRGRGRRPGRPRRERRPAVRTPLCRHVPDRDRGTAREVGRGHGAQRGTGPHHRAVRPGRLPHALPGGRGGPRRPAHRPAPPRRGAAGHLTSPRSVRGLAGSPVPARWSREPYA